MARPVFKIDSDGKAIIHPEVVDLLPEFKKLSKKEVLYIILAYDLNSPFRMYAEQERRSLARNRVYTTQANPEGKKIVEAAIELYKSLQFDSKRETIEIYKSKIAQLNDQLRDTNDIASINRITSGIDSLRKMLSAIEKDVDNEEVMEEIKGGASLSLIEEFQKNRSEHIKQMEFKSERELASKKEQEEIR